MLKTIVFICLAVALSGFAGVQFAGALEAASASRARRSEVKRRHLELGWQGRALFTAIFACVMLLLSWMSNIPMLSTIVALILAVGLVLALTYLRGNGISCLTAFLCVWIGNLISSLKNANFRSDAGGWSKTYVILQVICLILLFIGTVVANLHAAGITFRREDDDEETVEEDIDASSEDDSEDEESEDNADDAATEDDDDEEGYDEEDPFHEKFWKNLIYALLTLVIIGFIVSLGFWLEMKFDFFPPYIH